MNKLYKERYKLQRFGIGFMRLALEAQAPIVPVAVVGSEEQQPGAREPGAPRPLLGMPAFPITATFPLLGPLGILPLPVKYRLYFGEPLHFQGCADRRRRRHRRTGRDGEGRHRGALRARSARTPRRVQRMSTSRRRFGA